MDELLLLIAFATFGLGLVSGLCVAEWFFSRGYKRNSKGELVKQT